MSMNPVCSLVRIDDRILGSQSLDSLRSAIKWHSCFICQTETSDALHCPATVTGYNAGAGYKTLAADLKFLDQLGAVPEYVKIHQLDVGDGIEATLKAHQAKYHKKCRKRMNSLKLLWLKQRKLSTVPSDTSSTKTSPTRPVISDVRSLASVPQEDNSEILAAESKESTAINRYANVIAICNNLALIVSQCEMDQYFVRVRLLTHLQLYWTKGCNVTLQPETGFELENYNRGADFDIKTDMEAIPDTSYSTPAVDSGKSNPAVGENSLLNLRGASTVPLVKRKGQKRVAKRQLLTRCKRGEYRDDYEQKSNEVCPRISKSGRLTSFARKHKNHVEDYDDDDGDDDDVEYEDDADDDDYHPDSYDDAEKDEDHKMSHNENKSRPVPKSRRTAFLVYASVAQIPTPGAQRDTSEKLDRSKRDLSMNPACSPVKLGDRLSGDQSLSSSINWNLCCLCQTETDEVLTCPTGAKKLNFGYGYTTLAADLKAFVALNELPEHVKIQQLDVGDGIEATLRSNHAKYHTKCRQQFTALKVQRLIKRKLSAVPFQVAKDADKSDSRASICDARSPAAQKDKSETSDGVTDAPSAAGDATIPVTEEMKALAYSYRPRSWHKDYHKLQYSGKDCFRCPLCEKTFRWKSGLFRHRKAHERATTIPCKMCDVKFSHSAGLRSHMREIHNDQYKCTFCEKIVYTKKKLYAHLSLHNKKYGCTVCDKSFCVRSELNEHVFIKHQENPVYPYNCLKCSKGFLAEWQLKYHMNTHTKPFECPTCGKKFGMKRILKEHIAKHVRDGSNLESDMDYHCLVCVKVFGTSDELTKHLQVHDNICKVCGKSFKLPQSLKNHMEMHDTSLMPSTICDKCGETFVSVYVLKRHIKRLHSKSHECSICREKFATKNDLASHIDQHDVKQHLKCSRCEQVCSSWKELQTHRKTHKTVKTALCTVCGKCFQKDKINTHLQTHSGLRPYKCQLCEKSYLREWELRTHQFTHTGEKPYVCKTCGKGFLSKTVLRYHQLIHTGERPFKCEFCGETFGNPTTRCIHMKKHRAKDVFLTDVNKFL